MVDRAGVLAFCRWMRASTGLAWRIPMELEWEKASRGVDGRRFPWGDGFDDSWCCTLGSHPSRPLPSPVDGYPDDVSPYGVRGLAGNVRDICLDVFRKDGPAMDGERVEVADLPEPAEDLGESYVGRGGFWYGQHSSARTAFRIECYPSARFDYQGFRLVRSLSRK
jgi:serine/threonine-protein kinase